MTITREDYDQVVDNVLLDVLLDSGKTIQDRTNEIAQSFAFSEILRKELFGERI